MMKVLFLCTGNSARSQMAEAWARSMGAPYVEFQSAGSAPAECVHPLAVQVMGEAGIDLGSAVPKRFDPSVSRFDLVVAVCSQAAEQCPVGDFGMAVERWDLPDPAAAESSSDERLNVFRASRDQIRSRVQDLLVRLADLKG